MSIIKFLIDLAESPHYLYQEKLANQPMIIKQAFNNNDPTILRRFLSNSVYFSHETEVVRETIPC